MHPHEIFNRIRSECIISLGHVNLKQIRDRISINSFDHFTPEAYDLVIAYTQDFDLLLMETSQLNNITKKELEIEEIRRRVSIIDRSIYPRITNIAKDRIKKSR